MPANQRRIYREVYDRRGRVVRSADAFYNESKTIFERVLDFSGRFQRSLPRWVGRRSSDWAANGASDGPWDVVIRHAHPDGACTRGDHLRQRFDSSENQSQRTGPERTCKSGSSGGHRCGDHSQILRPSYQQGYRAICGPALGGKQSFNRDGVKRIDTESVEGIGWKCDHSPTSYHGRRRLH